MTEAENNAATEFSHAEWNAANLDKFNNADNFVQYHVEIIIILYI